MSAVTRLQKQSGVNGTELCQKVQCVPVVRRVWAELKQAKGRDKVPDNLV